MASTHNQLFVPKILYRIRRLTALIIRGRVSVKGGIPPRLATYPPVITSKASYYPLAYYLRATGQENKAKDLPAYHHQKSYS